MSFVFKRIHLGNENRRESPFSHPIRLCYLRKKSFEQYGFNLKSKNSEECHFIGKVDEETPAAESGLRAGDKIISINNQSIENFDYEQVVGLIKKGLTQNGEILENELILTVTEKEKE